MIGGWSVCLRLYRWYKSRGENTADDATEPDKEPSEEEKTLRIEIRNELPVIVVLALALIVVIQFAPDIEAMRIVLGLPFILFFPGYTLIAAFFPKKSDFAIIDRLVSSFGLSIAVVILVGFVLHYTWNIQLNSLLLSLTSFIVAMSAIAWYRKRGIAAEERSPLSLNFSMNKQWNSTKPDRVLSIILVLVVIGILGLTGYLIANPRIGERYSEFYILGAEGDADLYPRTIILDNNGNVSRVEYSHVLKQDVVLEAICPEREVVEVADNAARIIVGITNRERETMSYVVEVIFRGMLYEVIGPVELAHGENWEEEVGLVLQEPGGNQKVEFKLFRIRELGTEDEKHTLLSLWLGTQQLSARVVNQGNTDASYWIAVETKGTNEQETEIATVGPILIAPGEEWKPELDYASLENGSQRVEFLLYRDKSTLITNGNINKSERTLLLKEAISSSYPTLHLWIDVK